MIINVDCRLKDGESQESLTRRFFKKCKRAGILDEYRQSLIAETRSQARRRKRARNSWLRSVGKL